MPTKPPKPRCQTCKLGLIICVDHQLQCRNSAFSACNFCLRYRCETGACKTKICCEGAAARVREVAQVESQLQADRRGSSALVSRLPLQVASRLPLKEAVRRMVYAVCHMLDAAPGPVPRLPLDAAPGPVPRIPLKAGTALLHARNYAAPVPAQVSSFAPRDDVAAVCVMMPNLAADAPVVLPLSLSCAPAACPVPNLCEDVAVLKMPSPAVDAPVLPLSAVLPLSPAATCPVPNLDPAADMMTMRARPVSGSPHSNCQSPLTDRRHSCANCARMGQWCACSKGSHLTRRTQSLRNASTSLLGSAHLKSSGGSREPTEAQKITPVPFSPSDR